MRICFPPALILFCVFLTYQPEGGGEKRTCKLVDRKLRERGAQSSFPSPVHA